MYGEKIQQLLNAKGLKIGDFVELETQKNKYKGIIMPRIETGDRDTLVIKLSNGYNIGIEHGLIKEIKKIEEKINEKIERKTEKENNRDQKKKVNPDDEVVILGCGGTIASKIEYKTGAVHPAITTEELIQSFPQLKEKNIRTKMLFSLLSENITPEHWIQIAKAIEEEIKKGCKGIVLMHGTDTMSYTAAALSYMIKTPIPIVLVGAQRSSDRGSSDNMMNLFSAITAAESDIAEVAVCMHADENDEFCYLHRGTKVRKMHTSRRDAFKSINASSIAKIYSNDERIEILSQYSRRGERKFEINTKLNSNVAMIYIYPGIKKEIVEKIIETHEGIVLIGTGLGHVPSYLIDVIQKYSGKKPIVISSQTIYGRLNLNVYETGRNMIKAGVIGNLADWTPEAAFVKLMFALGQTNDVEKIKEIMNSDIVGEITERIEE